MPQNNPGFVKKKHIPEKPGNCVKNHIARKGQTLKVGLDYLSLKYFC